MRQLRPFWLLLLLLLPGLFTPSVFAQRTVTLEDYFSLIGTLRGEAFNAASQQGHLCQAQLQRIVDTLAEVDQVLLPDGQFVQVDHVQAGLPSIIGCSPDVVIRYLNGICPPTVCLTTGEAPTLPAPPQAPDPSTPSEPPDLNRFATENSQSSLPETAVSPESAPPPTAANGADNSELATSPENSADAAAENGNGAESTANAGEAPAEQTAVFGEDAAEAAGDDSAAGSEQGGNSGEAEATNSNLDENIAAGAETTNGVQGEVVQPGPEGTPLGTDGYPVPTDAIVEAGDTLSDAEQEVAAAPPQNGDASATAVSNEALLIDNEQGASFWQRWRWWIVGLSSLGVVALISLLIWQSRKTAVLPRTATARQVTEKIESGRQHFSEGEFRAAIRQLFLATLRALETRGKFRFNEALTNYELLQFAQSAPGVIDRLAPIVDAYDRVWYGYQPLSRDEFEQLADQIEQLKQFV